MFFFQKNIVKNDYNEYIHKSKTDKKKIKNDTKNTMKNLKKGFDMIIDNNNKENMNSLIC